MKIFSLNWITSFLGNTDIMDGIAIDMRNRGLGGGTSEFELAEDLSSGDLVKIIDSSGPKVAKITAESETFGILQESGVVGETKPVAILGELSKVHSGETPGTLLYVQPDLSSGSTETTFILGRFVSSTELLLNFNP